MTCLCEVSSCHWERQGRKCTFRHYWKSVSTRLSVILHKRGALKRPIHCLFLNRDPHKGVTVNTTRPFTVTFLTWKHMEVLNQTNCVFAPFDHCHLCIKPPLLTRASGVNKASRLKETCHNCSMTPQYHTTAPTRRSMTAQTRHWLTSAAPVVLRATVIGYMLPIVAWWRVRLTRRFRLQWDPKIEWNRLDPVDLISYRLLSGSPDGVNTGEKHVPIKN